MASETERWNRLHPGEKARVPYVSKCLADAPGVLVAASDYLKTLPNMISKWMPRAVGVAGHRWLWAQRRPHLLAGVFRSRLPVYHAGHAARAFGGRQDRALGRRPKLLKTLGINADKPESGDFLTPVS